MPAPHHPPSSPPDQPPQWFLFGPWAFDITAATGSIIRDQPRETVSVPVAPWARAYGLDRRPRQRHRHDPAFWLRPWLQQRLTRCPPACPADHHCHPALAGRPSMFSVLHMT
jgi:hypothetical protein